MGYPNDARQLGNYDRSGNKNDYMFVSGVCVLPLAEDPPTDPTELAAWSPVVVLRLHAPYRTRVFTQLGVKQQNPPPVAEPASSGKFVFLGGTVHTTTNLNASYRNFDWTVGCEYHFVEACVSRPQDGLILGSPQGSQATDDENYNQYEDQPPLIGAIAFAGKTAVVGYHQGETIIESNGSLRTRWGYNSSGFYPGTLFYSDLINGGPPVVLG